jgi:hypothetical protein
MKIPLAALATLALAGSAGPASAAVQPPHIDDALARHATRAMIIDRLGDNIFDLHCHRVHTAVIRCSWSFGTDGGRLAAYGEGTVSTLAPAAPDAPPRYRYDYAGSIGRRIGTTPRYRASRFHWRHTSPAHVSFARAVARRFQREADEQAAQYGATGSPDPAPSPPCSWRLLDDRTVAASCSARYSATTRQGAACEVVASANWLYGHLEMGPLDSSACDGSPG